MRKSVVVSEILKCGTYQVVGRQGYTRGDGESFIFKMGSLVTVSDAGPVANWPGMRVRKIVGISETGKPMSMNLGFDALVDRWFKRVEE